MLRFEPIAGYLCGLRLAGRQIDKMENIHERNLRGDHDLQ